MKREGKSRREQLGHYPTMTLADARDAALKFNNDLKGKKILPRDEGAMTVSEAFAAYMGSVEVRQLVEASQKERMRAFEKDIEPHIGSITVASLSRRDIDGVIQKKYKDSIASGGKGIGANRLFSTISAFISWCLANWSQTGLEISPMAGMKKPIRKGNSKRTLFQRTGNLVVF